jgi:hypothetical protein
MSLGKKTINLVKKLLNNENKRKLYSDEELQYMEFQLKRLIENRKRRKLQRKANKGFEPDKPVTSQNNTENFDD